MKRIRLAIVLMIIFCLSMISYASFYSISTDSKFGKTPAIGDLDGDGKYELVLINESNEMIIMNSENIKYYRNYLDSNWEKYKDIEKNEKDNRLYGIKLNINQNIASTPLLFDCNNDGIEDIVFTTENGIIISLDFNKLMSDYKSGKYTKLANYFLWKNSMDNVSSSAFSLFKKGGKYYGIIGTINEFLYIVNLQNGNFYRKIDLHKYSIIDKRKPIVDAALVYDLNNDNREDIIVGSNAGVFYAINGKTLTLLWKYAKKNSPILFSPSVVNMQSKKYLICTFKEYKIVLLDALTGKELWHYNTITPIVSAPLAADLTDDGKDNILVITEGGKVICFNAEDGSEPWNFKTSKVKATPVIYDVNGDLINDIFIANERGILEIYNGRTRELLEKYKFITKGLQTINSQPIIGDIDSNGILDICVNSTDGYFYMFTDPQKLSVFNGKLINATDKGDLFRTGNMKVNKRNNASLGRYLDNIRKKYAYNKGIEYLNTNNITQAAIYLKKVINIDSEYKDAQTQFDAIKDNFLDYEYKTFNDAIKNNNIKKGRNILRDVKSISSDFKNIPEMERALDQKIKDYAKADNLFREGKAQIKSRDIVGGYEKLETAYSLKPFDNKIKAEINRYSYEMELYRKLLRNEKEKKWTAADENLKNLMSKYPNFPGLAGHKNKIQINKNKFLFLGGVLVLIITIIVIVMSVKKKKLLEEELIEQSVITEKVEVSSNNAFSEKQGEEEDGPSINEMEDSGISLGIGSNLNDASENEENAETDIGDNYPEDEEDIQLGGIDMDLESNEENNEEAPAPKEELSESYSEINVEENDELNDNIEIAEQDKVEGNDDMLDENIEVRMSMAIQLYENSEFDKAGDEFKKISDIGKKYRYDAAAYLGFCYYEQKKLDESMKLIQSIPYNTEEIPLDERINVLKILGKGFIKNKLNKPAISVYKKLLTISNGMEKKDTLYNLGDIYEDLGDKENAIKYYKDLFLIDSNYKDVSEKLDELGFA
ncbi:PQQ-binding-like beta-propeller repeat protein [bacterium]|nr:PQQ-binding-like beta-propeller repeat protein [bacterium]